MKKTNFFISLLLCIFLISSIFPVYAEDNCYKSVDKERFIVKYKDDISNIEKQEIRTKYNKSNVSFKDLDEGLELWELDNGDDSITEIQKNPAIEFVQPDYKLAIYNENQGTVPSDLYFSYQWGLSNTGQTIGITGTPGVDIDATRAWQFTKGDSSVVVGVLDSGIDINHPDIKDNIYINMDEVPDNGVDDDNNGYIDDINGWDFYNKDKMVYDEFYEDIHGTLVSGIIAATSDTQGMCGVAPNIKILPLKFMSTIDGGYTSDAINAIKYAKSMGVKIINCSWTERNYNKALKVAMQKSKILFICAAGNYGLDVEVTPFYPACFNIPNVISVGAIDNQGKLASFSNFGTDVDVLAPGVNILSIIPDGGYLISGGTSLAAPFVTGIAALAQSLDRDIKENKLSKIIKKCVVRDDTYPVRTKGRVNAYNVLEDIIN
ncbi:S8 family peptidase [Clostridium sp. BNL1100]|uniref:S8 family peptidase n=1 Tax=Clostridium sp. BNL1100 TaxID=755731 RepID=UPI00024A71BF|nr:S8 family peptidase [Clostridium sp. BNL1100]AEY67207.1 subtilisin-like serine protease [Clostridium sp. BNL1100]